VPPLLKSPEINRFVNAKYEWFTQDQKKVVVHVLSSRDRFCIIQGDAGTGKTSAMGAVKEIIKAQNLPCTIYGLGYTGKAAKELENQADITSQTISSFLKNKAGDLNVAGKSGVQIWIVDESSMVGSRQMKQLIDCADKNNARLFFVGDCKQLQAIQAGRVFKDLQDKDFVQAIKMGEVLRQKTDHMKQTVAAIKNYQEGKGAAGIDEAFEILKRNEGINEIKNNKKRFDLVAKEAARGENYIETLIVTPKNEDRLALNNQIRSNLKKAGRLDDKDFSLTIKSPISLPGTSKYFASSYHVGQKAFVDTGGKQFLGLRSGKEVEIVDAIRVKTFEGKQRQIDLKEHSSKLSVFRQDNKDFCQGDKIVFLKNDRRLKVQNGLTGSIEKIDHKGTLTVKLNQIDKTISFNTRTYGYFDHGYAVTVHKSQGQTSKNVILVADSKSPQLNKTEAFYVAMSRGTHSAKIYTDDVESLKTQFKEAQEKTSTLAGHRQVISAPGVKTNIIKKNRETGRSK
jgi:ATP-dependent exoDNAse (exonuclease V) alpha subunit